MSWQMVPLGGLVPTTPPAARRHSCSGKGYVGTKKAYSKTDVEYLAEIDMADNYRLWRMFYHEERWAETMGVVAPVDHLIDLDTPSQLLAGPVPTQADLYEKLCRSVRRDLVVALPPVTFTSGGSVVADAIDIGVTSAPAGST